MLPLDSWRLCILELGRRGFVHVWTRHVVLVRLLNTIVSLWILGIISLTLLILIRLLSFDRRGVVELLLGHLEITNIIIRLIWSTRIVVNWMGGLMSMLQLRVVLIWFATRRFIRTFHFCLLLPHEVLHRTGAWSWVWGRTVLRTERFVC